MAMLPEWQNYPVFEAFGFITNDNNFDDEIKGFVLREETMTEFELPPRMRLQEIHRVPARPIRH